MPRGKAARSIELIHAAHDVLAEIHPASVRAVCYRLFTMGLIDSMSKPNTNRVGTQLVYAREHNIIPWSWIADETRDLERTNVFDDPEEYCDIMQRIYRRDRWLQQPHRCEVWSEKGTVRGTLASVLNNYAVGFRVLHGFGSATTVHDVAAETARSEQPLIAFYIGDYDPSGLRMSEVDLPERLERYRGNVDLRRIALTVDDVVDPQLPSFDVETKRGDPRYEWFRDRYGNRCWELDALSPVVLRERVEDAIVDLIDPAAWHRCGRVEELERTSLAETLGQWSALVSR